MRKSSRIFDRHWADEGRTQAEVKSKLSAAAAESQQSGCGSSSVPSSTSAPPHLPPHHKAGETGGDLMAQVRERPQRKTNSAPDGKPNFLPVRCIFRSYRSRCGSVLPLMMRESQCSQYGCNHGSPLCIWKTAYSSCAIVVSAASRRSALNSVLC